MRTPACICKYSIHPMLLSAIADKAPSSVYRGEIALFDSIKYRDIFNTNDHRSVATDLGLITNHNQRGRRIWHRDHIQSIRPNRSPGTQSLSNCHGAGCIS